MTNPTSYTDEQVLSAIEVLAINGLKKKARIVRSLLADRQRLQAEVKALRNAISKRPEIDADDMHWFESAFSAWSCGDIEGAVDGPSSAVNYFMPSMPDCSTLGATPNETKEAKS